MANLLAKLFKMEIIDNSDCPFVPDTVNGKTVLVKVGDHLLAK